MSLKPAGARTIHEYLDQIDEPRQTEIRMLHAMISKAVPKLKPSIQGGMIGYGTYHAVGLSGEGDFPVIAMASQKSYISVYVPGAEKHKAQLTGASVGKSCIRFTKITNINLKALEKVIKLGAKAMEKANYRVVAKRA
jgi:hypothetical protein